MRLMAVDFACFPVLMLRNFGSTKIVPAEVRYSRTRRYGILHHATLLDSSRRVNHGKTTTEINTIETSWQASTAPVVSTSTPFDTPIFGQTTHTAGRTTTSSSGAQPTAKGMLLCSSLFSVIALLQRMPLDAIEIIL